MNQLIPFKYQDTPVRTIMKDNEPWFVAKDICDILEIKNNRDALTRLSDDEKGVAQTDTLGGSQNLSVINEPGLYVLVLRSDKPQAEPFRRWVTHEVLPQLRKTGTYSVAELGRKELAQMVLEAEAELEEAKPKAEAYDRFISADGTYSVGNVAKMLGLSQNKLFHRLRNAGIFISKGAMRNTPYQKYMHHFMVKAYDYARSDNTVGSSYTTRVQPSGIDFICRKLGLSRNEAA